jgi:predicted porin
MKKTLIALAVLAASTASMAQVTLYGVADVAVGASDKTNAASGSNYGLANTSFQALANGSLTNGNSRFGLKGTEDLGGGMKAGFVFESSVNIATGANQGSGSLLFSRNAYVTLGGAFGEIKAGRQLNPTFLSIANWELTGTANYSVAMNQFGVAVSGGVRDNAEVTYSTPKMGGLGVSLGFVPEGNQQFGTAAAPKGKYDIAATYGAGPLAASLAYNKVADGVEATTLGGAYNFGMVTVGGSWNQVKDGAGNKATEGFTLGASLPMGAWTFTVDMAQDTISRAISSTDTDWLLEAKYALSKRTFVYGVYVADGKGKTAQDNSAYALGLRHNF